MNLGKMFRIETMRIEITYFQQQFTNMANEIMQISIDLLQKGQKLGGDYKEYL